MANIFIHIEVRKRELDGKFLLAAKAALRGHRVMLGYIDTLLAKGLLAPGIFHDKSLTPRPKKFRLLKAAREGGLAFTSIDEEHGLLQENYDVFAAQRYSAETLELASAVMFWGRHDHDALARLYPAYRSKFHLTGNPRADLWRPEMAEIFRQDLPVRRPFILFNSNLGAIVGQRSFADVLSRMRDGYFKGDEDETEFNLYKLNAYSSLLCGEYVRALRRLARDFPAVDFVLRPHPIENPESWKQLIGGYKNIIVTYEGSVTPWIRQCAALVHNGCTTAMEAVRSGVPVLTYTPVEDQNAEFHFPNRLGLQVPDLAALRDRIGEILAGKAAPQSFEAGQRILDERIADTGNILAADRMVDVWDSLVQPHHRSKDMLRQGSWSRLRAPADFLDVHRYATPPVMKLLGIKKIPVMPQKFDSWSQAELDTLLGRFSRLFPDFRKLKVKKIAPRICIMERAA